MNQALVPILILLSAYVLSAQINDVVMFRGNNMHTGAYQGQYNGSPKEFVWTFKADGAVRSTPVKYKDKIIFGSSDNNLYIMNSETGELLRKFSTNGPVNSSPAVDAEGFIYFLSGDNYLYCINSNDGALRWRYRTGRDLPYKWGFDYLVSSPAILDNTVFFGSGDGNLYALNKDDGSLTWKYSTGSRIRTSPAIYKNTVFFGNMEGKFYALNKSDGRLIWEFETEGGSSGNNMGEDAFDRTAIISSPAIEDSIVCFGGRDGYLYALNLNSGTQLWKFDHEISWVISSPAIVNDTVYTGSSDGHFVQALDLFTGREIWRSSTPGIVWCSPTVSGNHLYFGDGKGNLFQLESGSGKEDWRFKFSKWILSSVILYDDIICFGCDDGYVYALRGNGKVVEEKLMKAVFWENSSGYKWFRNKTDEYIKDYFVAQDYELLNSEKLKQFFEKRVGDRKRSVVVFASNRFPYSVIPDTSDHNLLTKYLRTGGKTIILGNNPLGYIRNPKTDKLVSIDYSVASKILDIKYKGTVTDALRGSYVSFPTDIGRKLGLNKWWTGFGGIEPSEVTTVLAMNEIGEATAWIKNFGGMEGSGFVQLRIDSSTPEDLTFIQQIAEFNP